VAANRPYCGGDAGEGFERFCRKIVKLLSPVKACIRTSAMAATELAAKTLEAFAGIAPQYGLFRRHLRTRRHALRASSAASRHHRRFERSHGPSPPSRRSPRLPLGKSIIRITPGASLTNLAGALKETLPISPLESLSPSSAPARPASHPPAIPPSSQPYS